MSDSTPTDAAKPARKPRKSAPRRRKPAAKAEATPDTQADAPSTSIATQPQATGSQEPEALPSRTAEAATQAGPGPTNTKPSPPAKPASPAPSSAKPSAAISRAATPAPAPAPRILIRVPLNVRWRDLDAFNHVNNSKYLSYLEEARLQWMLTMPGQGLDDHVAPVVAAANLNYRRPIEWPNEVMVELFVERLGNTSVSIGHRIIARDDASVLYCDGNVVMVWIDRGTGAAAPLPAEVRAACG
jgi:YbgC/YbaW family acyl-CoA thioester hydrolase